MADQFVGEIRPFAGNFAPVGWALCNGQLMPISQNTALFSLLGTNYGGDGITTFALPNLQGAFPLHAGSSAGSGLSQYRTGEQGGSATISLATTEMPSHTHTLMGALSPTTGTAGGTVALSPTSTSAPIYGGATNTRALGASTLAAAGGGVAHENRQPYLALTFIIALQGIFPPRS